MKIFKFFKMYLKEHLYGIYLILFFKIILTVLPLFFPFCTKNIIDLGILRSDVSTTLFWASMFMAIVCVRQLILIFFWRIETNINTKIIFSLRKKITQKLFKQSISYFEKKEQGELLTIINNDTERVENFALRTFYEIVLSMITFVIVLVIVFRLNIILALISLMCISIFPLFQRFFVGKFRENSAKEREALSKITSTFQQMFSNVYIVLSYNLQNKLLDRLDKPNNDLITSRINNETYGGIISLLIEMVLQFPLTIVTYGLGGYFVITGKMELGGLIAFSLYLSYLVSPISFFYRLKTSIAQINASFEKLEEVLSIPETQNENDNFDILAKEQYLIKFDNVSFSYSENTKVFKDFSLVLKPGCMVAICGNSGAGKSTLIKLLLRFHNVDLGNIFINGKDIKQYKLSSLREYFSIVPQESYFFQDTLLENFKIVKDDVTEEELDKYAEMTGLLDKIHSLPDKYNTDMGDKGNYFSGGEKQRLSIIRALLNNSPVIILDESTSQLDAGNERKLLETLKLINQEYQKTIIMVAHRLSTISKFNEIIVINNGEIVENGNHQNLMDKKAYYYQLWKETEHNHEIE
ncbi:MAG: ABC transporter ATP-binding protein [Candidatus Cloacimonetes bacterium]|nr:ABC transporter ATP-binding protein [Candidatus Cloacimonadota bacterium]